MGDVFIISAVRTPVGVGKPNGALAPLAPVDLAALVLREVVRRAGIEAGRVEDVVWGCVTPIGDQGANLGRLAVLKAGFPGNRACSDPQPYVRLGPAGSPLCLPGYPFR